MKSVENVLEKYLANGSSASAQKAYRDGIGSVQINPMEQAAAPEAEARYLANVQESVTSGRRRESLLKTSLQEWKSKAAAKADRLASGIRESKDRMRQFLSGFLPYVQQAADEVRRMPKGTLEDSKARAARMIELNAAAKGRF